MRALGIRWLACLLLVLVVFSPGRAPLLAGELSVTPQFRSSGETQPSDWRLQLEFSHPVSVLDIARSVTLTVNGKPGLFKILNALDLNSEPSGSPLSSERSTFILAPREPPLPEPPARSS